MIITGMAEFESVCRSQLVESYNKKFKEGHPKLHREIAVHDTFMCHGGKELQNYKGQFSTDIYGDGVYVEYTYNGDKQELYEDFYFKDTNRCIV